MDGLEHDHGIAATLLAMPVEILHQIARDIDDKDVCNLRGVCRGLNAVIEDDSFWRVRWHDTFDAPRAAMDTSEYKGHYQLRQRHLKAPADAFGYSTVSQEELRILFDLQLMVTDAASGPGNPQGSKNFALVEKFVRRTDIVKSLFCNRRRPKERVTGPEYAGPFTCLRQTGTSSYAATMLLFAHLMFDPTVQAGRDVHSFSLSQHMAYADDRLCPIFTGFNQTQVNLIWVMHIINFFRSHFMVAAQATMMEIYTSLVPAQRPQGPNSPLLSGAHPIGRRWNGTYSYLGRHDVRNLRRLGPDSNPGFEDCNLDMGEKSIQKLVIDFPKKFTAPWPKGFEGILKSLRDPQPQRTRAQHRDCVPELGWKNMEEASCRFIGMGYDDEDFYSQGWLNPLPPQSDCPGFQRFTMMKYFEDAGEVFHDALWAYEGVVLPGSRIIVGRWWSPQEEETGFMYCGPFIMWEVDDDDETEWSWETEQEDI